MATSPRSSPTTMPSPPRPRTGCPGTTSTRWCASPNNPPPQRSQPARRNADPARPPSARAGAQSRGRRPAEALLPKERIRSAWRALSPWPAGRLGRSECRAHARAEEPERVVGDRQGAVGRVARRVLLEARAQALELPDLAVPNAPEARGRWADGPRSASRLGDHAVASGTERGPGRRRRGRRGGPRRRRHRRGIRGRAGRGASFTMLTLPSSVRVYLAQSP